MAETRRWVEVWLARDADETGCIVALESRGKPVLNPSTDLWEPVFTRAWRPRTFYTMYEWPWPKMKKGHCELVDLEM